MWEHLICTLGLRTEYLGIVCRYASMLTAKKTEEYSHAAAHTRHVSSFHGIVQSI
jgi:hypothetical protein